MNKSSLSELTRLNKLALSPPWEAVIGDDNEHVCQCIGDNHLKPILALAQLSSKENEMRLVALMRNSLPELLKAVKERDELLAACKSWLNVDHDIREYEKACDSARKLISKIEENRNKTLTS